MKIKFNIKEELSFKGFSKYKKILDDLFKENFIREALYKLPDLGFKYLSSGSFRKVFSFPDNIDLVLKVVYSENDAIMNKREVQGHIQTKYSSILPKMYLAGKGYIWIVVEKVNPFSDYDLDKLSPDFKEPHDLTQFLYTLKSVCWGLNVKEAIKQTMESYEIKTISPAMHKIIDYVLEYDIAPREIRNANLGVTNDGRVVVLDSSFDDDI